MAWRAVLEVVEMKKNRVRRIASLYGREAEIGLLARLDRLKPDTRAAVSNQVFSLLEELVSSVETCESPIEELMAVVLSSYQMGHHTSTPFWIEQQQRVSVDGSTYRLDFVAHARINSHLVTVAIECDGHEFHERTKEQAARDKRRDRTIQSLGIPVLRFTGSEIWDHPMDCAHELLAVMRRLSERREES